MNPRVLREMIHSAREEREPDLPWDRIEARLFAELDDAASERPTGSDRTDSKPSTIPGNPIPAVAASEVSPIWLERPVASADQEASVTIGDTDDDAADVDSDWKTGSKARAAGSKSRPSRWTRWAGALAVAAALGGVWMIRSHGRSPSGGDTPVAVAEPIDTSTLPMAPGLSGARDLNALKEGDIVEAAVGPVAFGELGSMEWTLSAGSRLVVREGIGSGTHVVELESGSMRGSVAPGASTLLIISAGETEVVSLGAGAVFSVTRSSRRVVMHLEEGSASVGARGHRADGRIFMAPLVAAFSLDGGNTVELLPMEKASLDRPDRPIEVAQLPERANESDRDDSDRGEPAQDRRDAPGPLPRSPGPVAHAPVASHSDSASASKASVDPGEEPKPALGAVDPKSDTARLSDSALSSTLVSCIGKLRNERQAKAAEGVRILVNSTLRIVVNDDGSVKSAVFSPPLERELQGCAVFVLRSKLEAGGRVVSVPINLP